MKVSKALEGMLLNRMHGADVPLVFTQLTLLEWQSLMQWVLEIENAEDQRVEIDMNKAPEWFVQLVRGNRINAIQEVRASIRVNINRGDTGEKCANLVSSKNFIEAMEECIVAPSRPLLTSA